MAKMKFIKMVKDIEVDGDTIKIVGLLADGFTVSQIALAQKINARTLEGQMIRIKNQFSVTTLPQLVAFFFRNKLIK